MLPSFAPPLTGALSPPNAGCAALRRGPPPRLRSLRGPPPLVAPRPPLRSGPLVGARGQGRAVARLSPRRIFRLPHRGQTAGVGRYRSQRPASAIAGVPLSLLACNRRSCPLRPLLSRPCVAASCAPVRFGRVRTPLFARSAYALPVRPRLRLPKACCKMAASRHFATQLWGPSCDGGKRVSAHKETTQKNVRSRFATPAQVSKAPDPLKGRCPRP